MHLQACKRACLKQICQTCCRFGTPFICYYFCIPNSYLPMIVQCNVSKFLDFDAYSEYILVPNYLKHFYPDLGYSSGCFEANLCRCFALMITCKHVTNSNV
ncbi:hypothetical protein O6H91_06G016300 [Diphasiastrum complanatum]|uniref:Uncharacterized protein n=1 Tax=Diphasiastrum complanatum TaxID=34168 RepID=A0ACC2DB82_DIPCM|nr:hypothetical protein O6H91_06G016300 [Diphasiastrum complanatum]